MGFEGFPFVLGWELTLQCNLSCKHCGSKAGLTRSNELTTDEALAICDQLPDLLVQEVDFTGGEPLLRSDWSIIAKRLIEKGISTSILSNGLALTEKNIAEMKEVGISCVGVSLDGLEKTHDYIRGYKGSYMSVVEGIKLLQKYHLPVNLITTVNAMNINELSEMMNIIKSLGVKFWRLQTMIPFGRAIEFSNLHVSKAEIIKLGSFIKQNKAAALKDGLRIICSDGLMYIEDFEDEKPWTGCSAGIITCSITSDGKIKGCLSMSDNLIEGDLRKNKLWDIWFDENAFSYNRKFKTVDAGSNCTSCEKLDECKGGCSANSYAATNSFHNDPYCHYKITKVSELV